MIEIRHLTKSFDDLVVLNGISETVHPGEVIAVVGPSGTGKSTLLRCINLLERPTSGQVLIDGEDITAPGAHVPRLRQRTGMVFQSFNLFAHLTVLANLTMGPMRLLKQGRAEAELRAHELLRMVGLSEKAAHLPEELSGGQQQRVAIARALSMRPEIMLFDEPTSALDPTMVSEVLSVIRRLARDGMTMMIVTHELEFARDVAHRIFYMDDGVIYESGAPKAIMQAPQREKTRAFINRLRNFVYQIDSPDYDAYALNAEIELFCEKHFFGETLTRHAQLAVEESLGLYFSNPNHRAIKVTLSYAERKGDLTAFFVDRHAVHNWLEEADTEDALSQTVLKGIVHDLQWERTEDGNRVSMVLNERSVSAGGRADNDAGP